MGVWGIKGIESDDGLDALNVLSELASETTVFSLELVLNELVNQGYLDLDYANDDIDSDFCLLALCDVFVDFHHGKHLDFWNYDENDSINTKQGLVVKFDYTNEDLDLLINYLQLLHDDKVSDPTCHELVQLWEESSSYNDWLDYISNLIVSLKELSV